MESILYVLDSMHMPLLIDQSNVHWDEPYDWSQIYRLCKEFNNIPVIIIRQGMLASRNLYPLLKKFDNLFLEMSYFQVNRGLEDVRNKFGASRLIFGTGMPVYDPRIPITSIVFSRLSKKEKLMVAGDNLRNLLKGVKL